MEIKVIGSNSRGNCYLLNAESESLVLECGMPPAQVRTALQGETARIAGCLVTHRHNDHSGFLSAFVRTTGAEIYTIADVIQLQKPTIQAMCHSVPVKKPFKVGGFTVTALPVKHDVPCAAFVIQHKELGTLVFATDTYGFKYRIPANHWMLECNYVDDILQDHIDAGDVPESQRQRLLQSHMELQTTKAVLTGNDLTQCRTILLIHLSTENSYQQRVVSEIEKATGKLTYAAYAGLEITL